MADGRLRILLIEDDAGDALLVQRSLVEPSGSCAGFRLHRAASLAEGLESLARGGFELLLVDLNLPDSRGIETVRRVREHDAEVPIVVFSIAGDEDTALAALAAGAQDYLVKSELGETTLRRAIRYARERERLRREGERLQARLLHAQKLESLGMLAGGIAHDFNNLLTVVLANAQLAQRELPPKSAARSPLAAVLEAARFAARLTEQLLAYSGGSEAQLAPLSLSERVAEIERLLEKLVPTEVGLELELAEALPPVSADPGQVQQLVLNLVKNAAEAFGPGGGTVRVETAVTDVDAALAGHAVSGTEIAPGTAVELRVRDGGCGVDAETIERMFDPFFSTKLSGRGLGLAACHGIVRSHGGALIVESEPGRGTTVRTLFPPARRAGTARTRQARRDPQLRTRSTQAP